MILPNKYVSISESFIGESAKILAVLGKKRLSIEKLWQKLKNNETKLMTFEKYIQVVLFMFTCGLLNFSQEEGVLYNENLQS